MAVCLSPRCTRCLCDCGWRLQGKRRRREPWELSEQVITELHCCANPAQFASWRGPRWRLRYKNTGEEEDVCVLPLQRIYRREAPCTGDCSPAPAMGCLRSYRANLQDSSSAMPWHRGSSLKGERPLFFVPCRGTKPVPADHLRTSRVGEVRGIYRTTLGAPEKRSYWKMGGSRMQIADEIKKNHLNAKCKPLFQHCWGTRFAFL